MMNQKFQKTLFSFAIFIFFIFLNCAPLFAQPDPGGGPSCWPPPCVPLDGGISALLAAGVILGVKKVIDLKSREGRN